KKDLSVVSFIEYVKSFKAKVQQAPDLGVDKTIVGIFLKNSFPSAMYDSVIPELRLSGEEESLSVAIKKVGEELKDLRFAKKCYDTYGLEAFGLSPVKTGGLKAMSIHAVDGLPTMHRTGEIQDGPSIDRKDLYCDFCGRKGHAEKDCWIRARMSKEVKSSLKKKWQNRRKPRGSASSAKKSRGKGAYCKDSLKVSADQKVEISSSLEGGFSKEIDMLPDSGCTEMSIIDEKVVNEIHP
ncbi:hypothetical protein ADUPG1_003516, partial [Aduncisulcus paluster]